MTKILVAEDERDIRELVMFSLKGLGGFDVVQAPNGEEAVKVATAEHPDLILMDINLPEVDGYMLTSHLKTRPELHRVPIIAVTANVMRGDRERTLQAGCDGYIQKPIDVDALPRQINSFLREVNRG